MVEMDSGRGVPPLIAKSPSSQRTLVPSSSGGSRPSHRRLLAVANLQALTALLMLLFGVLSAVYGLALSRLGAGVSGGLIALLDGLLGAVAALFPSALHFTLYLALSLVSTAVNTLVLVLTLTAVVRDAQVDIEYLSLEDVSTYLPYYQSVIDGLCVHIRQTDFNGL